MSGPVSNAAVYRFIRASHFLLLHSISFHVIPLQCIPFHATPSCTYSFNQLNQFIPSSPFGLLISFIPFVPSIPPIPSIQFIPLTLLIRFIPRTPSCNPCIPFMYYIHPIIVSFVDPCSYACIHSSTRAFNHSCVPALEFIHS